MQRHRTRLTFIAATALTVAVTISACGSDDSNDDPAPQIANPASEFCVAQGGEVEIVDNADGQTGICNLPDGTSVDEWEYYRANNPDVTTP